MSDKVWYTAVGGQQQGPFSIAELLPRFQNGELARDTYVFTQGMDNWAPAGDRPEFQAAFGGGAAATPAAAPAAAPAPAAQAAAPQPAGQEAHEIDYEIFGQEMQYVEITLDPARPASPRPAPSSTWTRASRWRRCSVTARPRARRRRHGHADVGPASACSPVSRCS